MKTIYKFDATSSEASICAYFENKPTKNDLDLYFYEGRFDKAFEDAYACLANGLIDKGFCHYSDGDIVVTLRITEINLR
jgi:hypothetical protein